MGLAELPESAALAKQIDSTVLFRERETGRVRQSPAFLCPVDFLYNIMGLFKRGMVEEQDV